MFYDVVGVVGGEWVGVEYVVVFCGDTNDVLVVLVIGRCDVGSVHVL